MGIKSITTFATWTISSDYIRRYGAENTDKIINEYGSVLKKYLKRGLKIKAFSWM